MTPPRVIVVGGGLSGLSAAHTVYLNGGNVLVLDKNSKSDLQSRVRFSLLTRTARLLRWKLDKGHLRHQRRPYPDPGGPSNWRQRQAVL